MTTTKRKFGSAFDMAIAANRRQPEIMAAEREHHEQRVAMMNRPVERIDPAGRLDRLDAELSDFISGRRS